MGNLDRVVAGLRCRDVLEGLASYADGTLPADLVAKVNAHLQGCDYCERFGGEYAALVARLRELLSEDGADAPAVQARLRSRMHEVWSRETG